jgi:hypothetical protein
VSCPVPPVPGAVNVAPSLCYAPMLFGTVNVPNVYGYLLGPPAGVGASIPAHAPAPYPLVRVGPGFIPSQMLPPRTTPARAPAPPLSQGMGAGTVLIGVAAVAALGALAYWSYRQRRYRRRGNGPSAAKRRRNRHG